jgi:hypothetical protein
VDVLQVQEEKPIVILLDGLSGVASTRNGVGGVEFQLNVFRVSVFEDQMQVRGALAESIEMVVVAERNAKICGAFAQLSQEVAKTLALIL